MAQITKNQYESQLQHIFRLLLDGKTDEQIAKDLNISIRSVQRYKRRLESRYGAFQAAKTDSTLFLECSLFKSRMLKLYKGLEDVVTSTDKNITGAEKAKCAEVAANITIEVLKMESEGIHMAKNLINVEKKNTPLNNNLRGIHFSNNTKENDGYGHTKEEYDSNRKF